MDFASQELAELFRGDHVRDSAARCRNGSPEAGYAGRKETKGRRSQSSQAQFASLASGGFATEFHGRLGGRPYVPRFAEKHGAGVGQSYVVAVAIQKADAEFILKIANLLAQGGLRQAQLHRRPSEAEQFPDGDEIAQVAKFHGWQLIAFVYHAQRNKILSNARSPAQRKQQKGPENHAPPRSHHR